MGWGVGCHHTEQEVRGHDGWISWLKLLGREGFSPCSPMRQAAHTAKRRYSQRVKGPSMGNGAKVGPTTSK
jgi:hypothetical protein